MWGDDAGGGMGLNDGLNDNLLDGGEDARDSMLAYDNNGKPCNVKTVHVDRLNKNITLNVEVF